MGRRLLLLLVAGAITLFAASAASSRSALQSFTDPAGDSGTAADITAVTVDNDAAGNITFSITTNQATLASDALLLVPIDSDQNPATGQNGIDFLFALGATGYDFVLWNGTALVDAPNTTVHVSYSAGVARFVVNKTELGNTAAFNFFVLAAQISGGNIAATDAAPDTGAYSYSLTAAPPPPPTTTTPPPPPPPPPPTVGLGKVALGAAGLHAGQLFLVKDHVTTTAAAVKVSCVVKVSGKAVRVLGAYARATHTATCSGRAPVGTAGKRLAGTMTVTISGDRDSKTFSFFINK
jgi:hypothetical protein